MTVNDLNNDYVQIILYNGSHASYTATHSMSMEASVVNEIFKLSVQYGTIICQINLFLHLVLPILCLVF